MASGSGSGWRANPFFEGFTSSLAAALGDSSEWPSLMTASAQQVEGSTDLDSALLMDSAAGDEPGTTAIGPGVSLDEAEDEDPEQNKHVCPTCFKTFNRPSSLRTHMHTHTGALPFVCPFSGCEQGFNVKSNMRRHYRTHRGMKNAELPAVLPTTSSGKRAARGRRRKSAEEQDLPLVEESSTSATARAMPVDDILMPITAEPASTSISTSTIASSSAFSQPANPPPTPPLPEHLYPPIPQYDYDFSGFAGMATHGRDGAAGFGIATGLGFRTAAMLMTDLRPGPTLVQGQLPRPMDVSMPGTTPAELGLEMPIPGEMPMPMDTQMNQSGDGDGDGESEESSGLRIETSAVRETE
uniref:C2H2-type domain-containing protein n=1 Tax=Mycena chlorophos TaxID=658473 RepID=A0ABQ0L8Q9_MYCCL|nr:predicted protein [Mycena chlorophos]